MNVTTLVSDVKELIRRTGAFILKEAEQFDGGQIEVKSLNSLVSYVDQEAEKMLVEGLRVLTPDAGFLTEEEVTQDELKDWYWIIDPLDGTTNFMHGLPVYSISVALYHKQEAQFGVVYELGRKELFHALKEGGAFCNDQPIQVAQEAQLKNTLLATGFPYYDFSGVPGFLELLAFYMKNTRGIRRMGSAAVDLAYVAAGRFDAFYEYGLNPWDVAAGALLVQEAGGKVSDYSGENDYLHGKEIIAASTSIFPEVLSATKRFQK